ncbi:hypothetical protein ACIBEJ_34685 [Nonomuraea sp. NPDC050790]|uniref:hypothetical protein n=1 Tax=Nonomuraea sp. NPDC050790 TaxID=3364371 RepID=UPI0037A89F0F
MKASKTIVVATALVALSLSLAACGDDSESVTADCVVKQADGSHKAVDDDLCDRSGGHGSSFVWIYGGTSSGGYIRGGTTTRPANTNISTRSGKTIVGGFGSSSKGGSGS